MNEENEWWEASQKDPRDGIIRQSEDKAHRGVAVVLEDNIPRHIGLGANREWFPYVEIWAMKPSQR